MEMVVASGGMPAYMQEDLESLAGAGVSTRAEDFALPFLAIAQSNSPQVKRQQPDKYIEGLEPGDIFNTTSRKFWRAAEGVSVVPVWFQKAWVEWILRDEGGGYVATYPIDDPIREQAKFGGKDKRYLLLPSGHQLVDTSYHFVVDPETGGVLIVSMTSTGLSCSRQWQTMMKDTRLPYQGTMVTAPGFACKYRLRSVYKKNDQGDWFTWAVSPDGWTPGNIYPVARSFFLEAQENGVVLGRPPVTDEETTTGASVETDTPI